MSTQYVSSVGYTAVTVWAANTVLAAGSIRRQLSVSLGSERCFRTANGGTTGGTEPVWVLTAGSLSPTDGTITDWTEITGQEAYQTSGGSWLAPHARTTVAFATGWMAAGDTCYIREDSAEVRAATQNISSPGTIALPCRLICVKSACSIPPVSGDERTTAIIQVTGSFSVAVNGIVYIYGVQFIAGSGSTNTSSIIFANTTTQGIVADNCLLRLNNTGTTSSIAINNLGTSLAGRIILRNCTFQFGATAQGFQYGRGSIEIIGGSLTGSAINSLVKAISPDGPGGPISFRNVDLSNMGASKTLVAALARSSNILFERCKFGASAVIAATQTIDEVNVDVVNCDSGATNYRNERRSLFGALTTETTIVLTGGASDGVTPFSHKIVTTANASYQMPFNSFTMGEFFADTAGVPISQTFELLTDGITLTNKDAWIELEYINSSATPLGALLSNRAGALETGTDLTTSTADWTTTGLASPVKQKIVTTFTPQMKGLFRAVLKVARPSTTLYLSPPAAKAA